MSKAAGAICPPVHGQLAALIDASHSHPITLFVVAILSTLVAIAFAGVCISGHGPDGGLWWTLGSFALSAVTNALLYFSLQKENPKIVLPKKEMKPDLIETRVRTLAPPLISRIFHFFLDPRKPASMEIWLKRFTTTYPNHQLNALEVMSKIYLEGTWFSPQKIRILQTPSITHHSSVIHNTTLLRRSVSLNVISKKFVAEEAHPDGKQYFHLQSRKWHPYPKALTHPVTHIGKKYLIDQRFGLWLRETGEKCCDFSKEFDGLINQDELLVASFSYNDQLVVMGSKNGDVQSWDLNSRKKISSFECAGEVWFADTMRDGSVVCGYSLQKTDHVRIVGREDKSFQVGGEHALWCLPICCYQKSKNVLFTASESKNVLTLIDLKSSQSFNFNPPDGVLGPVTGMAVQANVLAVGFGFKQIALFNINLRKWITTINFSEKLQWENETAPIDKMAPLAIMEGQIVVSCLKANQRCITTITFPQAQITRTQSGTL